MNKFFNNGSWPLPVTLESLSRDFPEAFSEIARFDGPQRQVMLELLNGKSTCPAGYGIADSEFIKEDSIISILRTKHLIDIASCQVAGRMRKHFMKAEHIEEFLNDREAMRKRIGKEVHLAQERKLQNDLRRALKLKGREWVKAKLKGYQFKNAVNDDYF